MILASRLVFDPARILVIAALLAGPEAVAESSVHVDLVTTFVERSERILSEGGPGAAGRLEAVYRSYFDLAGLAARVTPERLWITADKKQRYQVARALACRLAVESVRRASHEAPKSWDVIGSRPVPGGRIVAVRFTFARNAQRTLRFDIARTDRGLRVTDIASEGGRLSVRLSRQFAEISRGMVNPPDVRRWLHALECRAHVK